MTKKVTLSTALRSANVSASVKELARINNELTRVKYLIKSVAARKLNSDKDTEILTAVDNALISMRKIRLGGIVKKAAIVQLTQLTGKQAATLAKEVKSVNNWCYTITSTADRLLGICIKLVGELHNSRVSTATKLATLNEVQPAVDALTELASISAVRDKFARALNIIASATEATDETSTQTVTDASEQPETDRMTNVSSETPQATTDAEKHLTDTDTTVTSSVVSTGGYYVDPEYRDDAPKHVDLLEVSAYNEAV